MTKVLIADHSKPSLVMTSEIFKDKIPGATVVVASTGEQAIALAETEKPDLCVIDFDLPDVDGASLITALRRSFGGPIFMTAFADDTVNQAVRDLLFAFNDASGFIKKPVKFDDLSARVNEFLLDGRRLGKRFDTELETLIIGKAEGRGHRAPKSSGTVTNISLGGARISLGEVIKLKKNQDLTVAIQFPVPSTAKPKAKVKPTAKISKATKKPKRASAVKTTEAKIKATVAWVRKDEVGVSFLKLSDIQKTGLESFLRQNILEAV